jgi:hypothetical protein
LAPRADLASHGPEAGTGGPARGYKWADAEPGNLLAATHGFHIDPTLRAEHRAELDEIGATVWDLLPVKRPEFRLAVEQLAVKLWRQRRAYRDLSEHGLVHEGGKPAPLLAEVAKVENAIQRDLVELGLTPRSAAALGLDLARGERELSVLEYYEQRERAGLPLFGNSESDE